MHNGRNFWRAAILASILLLLGVCLGSCTGGQPQENSGTTDPETETTEPETPIVFRKGEETPYVIVVGKNASEAEQQAAKELYDAFLNRLSLTLPMKIDLIMESAGYTEIATEILVGNTNRDLSALEWDTSDSRLADYCVAKCGEKIVLRGLSDTGTASAVSYFIETYLPKGCTEVGFSDSDNGFYEGEYSLSSFCLNGEELKSFNLQTARSSSLLNSGLSDLIQSIQSVYGYSVTLNKSESEQNLLIGVVDDYEEYRDLLGDKNAVLTSKDGVPALISKNLNTLLRAISSFSAFLKDTETVSLEDGSISYATEEDGMLSSMSFNILGSTDLQKRKAAVLWVISTYLPDTIGFQEGKTEWLLALDELSDLYERVGDGNKEEGYSETYNWILYKKDVFDLVDSGTIWLSDDIHEAGSKFPESKRVRTATYARLRVKASGEEVLYVNTHLDNLSAVPREKQLAVLLQFISGYDIPCVLSGDFNSTQSTKVYQTVTSVMDDSRTTAEEKILYPTYNGLGSGSVSVLDYLFFSKEDFRISYFRVNTALYNGSVYPSDHNSIYAEYRLKE